MEFINCLDDTLRTEYCYYMNYHNIKASPQRAQSSHKSFNEVFRCNIIVTNLF